ncbi:MAG: HdeD family acid-resistance protein [Halopseudomonas sabulinigri]|tara:strand:+ start:2519 stop:3112 length:594 start_codon:yes stop_codon:yes gene_type:complete
MKPTVEPSSTGTAAVPALLGDLSRNWGWLLALGILFIVLGLIGLGMSVTLTIATVFLFGVMLLAGGALQLVDAIRSKNSGGRLISGLMGALYLLGGFLLISKPLAGSAVITLLLGAAFFAIGLVRIMLGMQLRGTGSNWGWLVFAGGISLLLACMIFLQWPASALWLIGILVAIEMLVHGCAYVMLALAAKAVSRNL